MVKRSRQLLWKTQKIILPTTNSGYGIGEKNKYCDEQSPLNPISLYGKYKVVIEKIILKMAEKNIETRPLWKPMHLQPLFKNAIGEIDGTSEKLFNNGLCLPSGSSLSSDEVDFVAKSLKELIE